jgi:hypothetical protein
MFTVVTVFCKYDYYSEHYGGFGLGKNNPRYKIGNWIFKDHEQFLHLCKNHLKKKEEKQAERQGEGTLVAHMK